MAYFNICPKCGSHLDPGERCDCTEDKTPSSGCRRSSTTPAILFSREWAMPNSKTFSIPPIKALIEKYKEPNMVVVDPFSGGSEIGTITNDLDPDKPADFHMEATEFLRRLETGSADLVLYDPPYSPRQLSEVYKAFDLSVTMETTQSSYWARQKAEIARICKPGGRVITFGWNSGGIGKRYGLTIEEILLVAHGGWHNDTICTVERKKTGDQTQ